VQELAMVLGWLVSTPPLIVPRPSSRDAPESHEVPTVAHSGAFSVELYTAVCAPPPDELTVNAMEVLWLSEPEVPVTVTVAAPVVAVAEAVKVSTEVALPFAGGVTGLAENAAVTPVGRPVALSVVAELKLFWLVMVIVLVPLLPWTTVREAGEAPMVKFGLAAAFTVRASVVVATRLPEVPVMVTVAVPVVAELLAVSVSVLVEVVGFGLNAAVTPLGRPDAARPTLPVNPPKSVTVTVLVPPAPPCVMLRLLGESDTVKLGVEDPARALIRFCPFGLPHPVTRS
jgi:hypothetical protein